MEQSPNGLRPPRVPRTGLSKRPLYILILAVLALMAALFYAVEYNDQKQQRRMEEEKTTVGVDDNILTQINSEGLVLPPVDQTVITAQQPAITPRKSLIVEFGGKNNQKSESDTEITRKQKLVLSALSAPLIAQQNNSAARPGETLTKVDETSRRGRASDEYRRRAAEHGSGAYSNPHGYDPAADIDREKFFTRADISGSHGWLSRYTRESGRRYEIKTGTVIPGVMITGINSDLPGVMIAQVSQNVYDTATGNHLLLPQGAKLYGVYDSRIAYGQSRVLIAWNRVIFPDGTSVTLGAFPGTDVSGYAGFNDKVNNHYLRVFGGAFLMSAIIGSTAYAIDSMDHSSNDNPSLQDELGSALASQMSQAALKLLEKNINIKPTIEIRPGYQFNVITTKDIAFNSSYTPVSY